MIRSVGDSYDKSSPFCDRALLDTFPLDASTIGALGFYVALRDRWHPNDSFFVSRGRPPPAQRKPWRFIVHMPRVA
jgi:hypothetical protein